MSIDLYLRHTTYTFVIWPILVSYDLYLYRTSYDLCHMIWVSPPGVNATKAVRLHTIILDSFHPKSWNTNNSQHRKRNFVSTTSDQNSITINLPLKVRSFVAVSADYTYWPYPHSTGLRIVKVRTHTKNVSALCNSSVVQLLKVLNILLRQSLLS